MALSEEAQAFLERMDSDLFELSEIEGFEEVAQSIYEESQAEAERLCPGGENVGVIDVERIAFVLTMQSEAINKLVDEIEALRPSIRFITSVLLGNQEAEADD